MLLLGDSFIGLIYYTLCVLKGDIPVVDIVKSTSRLNLTFVNKIDQCWQKEIRFKFKDLRHITCMVEAMAAKRRNSQFKGKREHFILMASLPCRMRTRILIQVEISVPKMGTVTISPM